MIYISLKKVVRPIKESGLLVQLAPLLIFAPLGIPINTLTKDLSVNVAIVLQGSVQVHSLPIAAGTFPTSSISLTFVGARTLGSNSPGQQALQFRQLDRMNANWILHYAIVDRFEARWNHLSAFIPAIHQGR